VSNKIPEHEYLTEAGWRWNYLLVDGVALPEAEKQLYQACECPEHVNLYSGTVYGDISDVAPLLVRVTFEHPLVQRLIDEDFSQEWGYLLSSSVELPRLAGWFRQFITVRHPAGVDLFLRFAEPAVASVLFGDGGPFRRAGTPVDEVLLPDSLAWNWQHVQMPRVPDQISVGTLTLSENEIDALTQVDRRNLLRRMVVHLDEFFPEWTSGPDRKEQIATLSRLLDLARNAHYRSERALTQWTNVFGFLRPGRVPEELPELIQTLLRTIPANSDAETAAREAAVLARQSVQPTTNENSGTEQTT